MIFSVWGADNTVVLYAVSENYFIRVKRQQPKNPSEKKADGPKKLANDCSSRRKAATCLRASMVMAVGGYAERRKEEQLGVAQEDSDKRA